MTEHKFKLGKKNTNKIGKKISYNLNNKKAGPISFSNLLSNVRMKKTIINNNLFSNSSLLDKKLFTQNSFNTSDNNYIWNNINNNNIIVNNYNNYNNSGNKKLVNSFSINNKNIFPDDSNENNSNLNFANISNSNSILKELFKKNNNINKKESSRKNIMKFIKKFQKNNNQKSKNK